MRTEYDAFAEVYDADTGRYVDDFEFYTRNDFIYHWLDQDGNVTRSRYRHFSLCWIGPNEFRHLLARAGFVNAQLFGGFDQRPFDEISQEQVRIAQKPA